MKNTLYVIASVIQELHNPNHFSLSWWNNSAASSSVLNVSVYADDTVVFCNKETPVCKVKLESGNVKIHPHIHIVKDR